MAQLINAILTSVSHFKAGWSFFYRTVSTSLTSIVFWGHVHIGQGYDQCIGFYLLDTTSSLSDSAPFKVTQDWFRWVSGAQPRLHPLPSECDCSLWSHALCNLDGVYSDGPIQLQCPSTSLWWLKHGVDMLAVYLGHFLSGRPTWVVAERKKQNKTSLDNWWPVIDVNVSGYPGWETSLVCNYKSRKKKLSRKSWLGSFGGVS